MLIVAYVGVWVEDPFVPLFSKLPIMWFNENAKRKVFIGVLKSF